MTLLCRFLWRKEQAVATQSRPSQFLQAGLCHPSEANLRSSSALPRPPPNYHNSSYLHRATMEASTNDHLVLHQCNYSSPYLNAPRRASKLTHANSSSRPPGKPDLQSLPGFLQTRLGPDLPLSPPPRRIWGTYLLPFSR